MAQNPDDDYFSHKGAFDLQGEGLERVSAYEQDPGVSEDNGSSKATLPTPLYTPPALSNSLQITHAGEETSTDPSSNDIPLDILTPSSESGSPNTARRDRNSTSPTPRLQIDTNLRPGSFSISGQTTPYSDITLFSGSNADPNPEFKIKLEDPSPKNRPRSHSEPPKVARPPSSLKPSASITKSDPEPHGLRPQSSVSQTASATTPHVLRTPATPNTLSRLPSRRKHFVAHNPFTTHSHPDVVAKHEKKDLTFDQIRTPMTPRVTFASGHEDGVERRGELSSSRDYYTPVGSHHHPLRSQLGRSLSMSDRREPRRNNSLVESSTGARRYSSLRSDTHSSRRDSVLSSASAMSDYTEDSTTAHESHSNVQTDANAQPKSPYPTNRRRDPFKHEDDDMFDDDKDVSISPSSFPRQDTFESTSGYSTDDVEKIGDMKKVFGSSVKAKESLASWAIHFVGSTVPRQLYLHFLLRLPLLYFSRVSRIFEEADLSMPEIKRMALETPQSANKLKLNRLDLADLEAANIPLEYQSLSATWEFFIDSLLREWKIINIVSGLLLSAILTLLQIDGAASNPFIRFTSLFSLICSLISLLYGCMYIIRFGTMRKPYKAAEWALEARNKTMIWWNVWVLLAMPAIWLTWSIVLYIVCIMAFAWQTTSQVEANPSPLSPNVLLGVRVLLSVVLGLGVIYGTLILTTFSRYGEIMDRTWKQRIDEWADEKATAAAPTGILSEDSDPTQALSDSQTTYPSDRKPIGMQAPRTPISSSSNSPPEYFIPALDENHHIHLPPLHELAGANLGKKPSLSREKRRVRFESPRDSPADSLGESLPFDAESEEGEAAREVENDTATQSEHEE